MTDLANDLLTLWLNAGNLTPEDVRRLVIRLANAEEALRKLNLPVPGDPP